MKQAKKGIKRNFKKTFKKSPAHASQQRAFGQTYLYVMGNFPFLWKAKFGISDNPKARTAFVDKSTAGTVYRIASVHAAWGYGFEQFVRFIYMPLNAPFKRGSGRSEWFLALNPLVGLIFTALEILGINADFFAWFAAFTGYNIAPGGLGWWLVLAWICPGVWLDGLLMLLIAHLFKYILMLLAFFGIIYFLSNLTGGSVV